MVALLRWDAAQGYGRFARTTGSPLVYRNPLALVNRLVLSIVILWQFGTCLLWAARAVADIPEVYQGREIVGVEVAGESAAIADVAKLQFPPGTRLSRNLLRELSFRLLESRQWVDVQIDVLPGEGGVRLLLRLRPEVVVVRVQFRGNEELDDVELHDVIRIADGSAVTEDELAEAAARVRRAYADRGYLSANVSTSFRATTDPSRKVLMVDILEGAPTRLERITFSGDPPLNPRQVLRVMGVATGDILDRSALREATEEGARYLRRSGYFEAQLAEPVVTVTNGRAHVVIAARTGPHYELRIDGFEPLTHQDIVGVLDFEQKPLTHVYRTATLPAKLRELYERHGMPNAQLHIWRLRGKKPNTAVLRIHIEPGKPLRIVNIEFPGAYLLDAELLRDQVYSYLEEDLPGNGLMQPVDAEVADDLTDSKGTHARLTPAPLEKNPREIFYENTYRAAIEHIGNLGRGQGFLSIKVGPATLRRVEGSESDAVVEIPIEEGPRTRLHAVTLTGAEVITPRELLLASGLERNQPFSFVALEEARLRMLEAYKERGYAFARVEPQVRFSGDRTRAEVLIEVVERFPVHIGAVEIRGAERTNPSYIASVVTMAKGDLFRPSEARRSEEALQALGIFTAVVIELDEPDLPARVKTLIVEVSERTNQYLNFSSGVSTGQGLRGGFEYGYRNLFGSAVGLALRVQLAYQLFFVDKQVEQRFKELTALNQRLERRVSLGIAIPRTPLIEEVKTSLDFVHLRDNERDFGIESNGVGLTFTYQPLRKVTTVFGSNLENNNVDLFVAEKLSEYLAQTTNPRLRRLLRVPEGDTSLATVSGTVSFDQRDSPFTPTRGYFLSLASEVARTLGTSQSNAVTIGDHFESSFLKLEFTASAYLPIDKGVVIAGQFRIGRIIHFNPQSQTYPNRAFFLGGVDTLRGYFQQAMVPQDLADQIIADPNLSAGGVVRSGDAFALARSEVRFPLQGDLRGGVFLDMGNLWKDPTLLNPFDLRPSVGAGIRLATPVGPIALDYGVLVRRRRRLQEPFGALHFSIGLF